MSNTIYSFKPIINVESRILILGTLPGAKSLAMNQYYADSKNQFWKIIYRVFDRTEIDEQYEDRIKFLLDNGIAIWDVLHSVVREGSLDINIKDKTTNCVPGLLQNYPSIKCIVFNGKKAESYFEYHVSVDTVSVPSSSSAYAITIDEKILKWKNEIFKER